MAMKSGKRFACLTGLALMGWMSCTGSAMSATAGSENPPSGMTVIKLGTAVPSWGYFAVAETLSPAFQAAACAWGLLYVDMTSPAGRATHATLTAAKLLDRKLARLDWSQSGAPGSQCFVNVVQLAD